MTGLMLHFYRFGITASVHTGTFDILEYDSKPVFLDTESDKTFIPAPKYYWKVLHDTVNNSAMAFIGMGF